MKIKSITISNWKSFKEHGPIEFSEGLNIIIGPNSSGKTNLANALRMVCGYGPDYGGGFSLRGNNEIQGRDFHIPAKPFSLQLETELGKETPLSKTIEDIGLFKEFHKDLKPRFFPVGARRELIELISPDYYDVSLSDIDWKDILKILEEVFEYVDGLHWEELPAKPQKDDFSKLLNDKGQRLTEAGSGYSEIVYLLIELKVHQKRGVKCYLFEEPEVNMHPKLLRQLSKYLSSLSKDEQVQFFITTHDAMFINEALKNNGKVHQVIKKGGISKVITTSSSEQLRKLVYDQLGNSPGDILLANYVIWVEGPSDVIYIKHWLSEAGVDDKDYTFMFYGGSCIRHLSFEDVDKKKLIHLCRLCANWTIVIDSDINTNCCEDIDPKDEKLRFHLKPNTKYFLEKHPQNCWITGGKEIENYVHPEVLKEALPEGKEVIDIRFGCAIKEWEDYKKRKGKRDIADKVVEYYKAEIKNGSTFSYDRWGLDIEVQLLKERIEKSSQ